MGTRRSLHARPTGLSMLESLLVAGVAAGLLATAGPQVAQWRSQQAVRAAAAHFETDVHHARSLAVARHAAVRLSIHDTAAGGTCYLVHGGPREACHCDSRGVALCQDGHPLWQSVHFEPGSDVRLTSNVSGMLFDPTMGTVTPTGTVSFTSRDGRAVRAVVSILGRVRQCSPGRRLPDLLPC